MDSKLFLTILITIFFLDIGLAKDQVMQWKNYAGNKDFVDYGGGIISFDCIKAHNQTCHAKSALNNLRQGKKIDLDLTGGKNPVKTLCFKLEGTTSVYKLVSKSKKTEETFCDFKDGSSVRVGDLWRVYLQN